MMKNRAKRRNFTIVELLTVIAIMAVLMGMGVGVFVYVGTASASAKTEALIRKIAIALESYKAKHGYYLQQGVANAFYLDWMNTAVTTGTELASNNFNAFIDYEVMKQDTLVYASTATREHRWVVDGFGNPIYYRCPGKKNTKSFDLASLGPNGGIGRGDNDKPAGTPGTASFETDLYDGLGNGDDITNFK